MVPVKDKKYTRMLLNKIVQYQRLFAKLSFSTISVQFPAVNRHEKIQKNHVIEKKKNRIQFGDFSIFQLFKPIVIENFRKGEQKLLIELAPKIQLPVNLS